MMIQMPPMKEIMCDRTFINIKLLLIATVVATLLICDITSAQNPYGLKRPSYCSTCFSNDKSENYYCCYYFFRCCAESRLGSNNQKVTTPSPQYPDLHTTHAPQTPDDDAICKKCILRNSGNSRKPEASGIAAPSGDDDTKFSADEEQKAEEVTPRYVDVSELSRGNSGSKRNPDTVYSSAFGGRRYPYNVPRVYPSQQPSRNNEWRPSQNWNSNPGRSNTRYKETVQDSTRFRVRQSGRPSGQDSGEILWSRMEPVKDDTQWT